MNGRLQLERTETRLVLTDPRSAATSRALLRGVGLMLCVGGVVMLIGLVNQILHQANPGLPFLISAIVAILCGILCVARAKDVTQHPRVLIVENGRLYTNGVPEHNRLYRLLRPCRFVASIGSTDILTGRRMQSLCVQYRLGYRVPLIPRLYSDEVAWACRELNSAIAADR
jgi:hypothetical protein